MAFPLSFRPRPPRIPRPLSPRTYNPAGAIYPQHAPGPGLRGAPGVGPRQAGPARAQPPGYFDPYSGLPSDPQLRAQAQQWVMAQQDPLIKAITAAYAARSRQGTSAILSLTQGLGSLFSQYGPTVGAAYGQAEQQLGAANTALSDRLTGQGQTVADQTVAALQKAGQDTSYGSRLAGVGKGAGGAEYAVNNAALEALIAEAAHAKDYGAKLPGIAGLEGIANEKQFQAQLTQSQAAELAQIRAQSPGMFNSVMSTLFGNRASQASARSSAYFQQQNLNEKDRLARMSAIIASGVDPRTGQLTPKARADLARASGYDPVTGRPTAQTQTAGARAQAAGASLNERIRHDQALERAARQRGDQAAVRAAQADARRAQAAQVSASARATAVAKAGAARTGRYTLQPKIVNGVQVYAGGKPVMVRTRVGDRATAAYYQTLHRVEAAIDPILAPYMSRADRIRFAQHVVNTYYASGTGGRPGTGRRPRRVTSSAAAPSNPFLNPTPPPFTPTLSS